MRKTELDAAHQRIARRYYYAVGLILFLIGVALMLVPPAIHREGEFWKILGELGTFLALIVALHFIYEVAVKRHEHQLLVSDIESIVSGKLEQIDDTLHLSRASIYPGQAEAYGAVAKAIARTSLKQQGEKALLLVALHGHSGKRRTTRPESDTTHSSFVKQMYECVHSSGPGKWYVRELYNITDEDRLQMVLGRLERAGDAEGYEVRAFCLENVTPQLTPLVVGEEDLFIGLDDPTYYGANSSFHIRGHAFVQTATEYFNSLWNDERAFRLRSGVGLDFEQVNSLREAVKEAERSSRVVIRRPSTRSRTK